MVIHYNSFLVKICVISLHEAITPGLNTLDAPFLFTAKKYTLVYLIQCAVLWYTHVVSTVLLYVRHLLGNIPNDITTGIWARHDLLIKTDEKKIPFYPNIIFTVLLSAVSIEKIIPLNVITYHFIIPYISVNYDKKYFVLLGIV